MRLSLVNIVSIIKIDCQPQRDYLLKVYDALGNKLQKGVTAQGITTTTDYANGLMYKNGQLQFASQPEGYLQPKTNGSLGYVYQYTDHLGNIRLSYKKGSSDELIVVEENNYYPFGMRHEGYNNVVDGEENPYRYNGKELNEELGLGWYDYGARFYEPTLARWMAVDPLAEKYAPWSPYNYVLGNPVRLIDPDGRSVDDIIISGSKENINIYKNFVNKALGPNYKIEIQDDGKVKIMSTSANETMTEGQKAFYESYSEIAENPDYTVEHELVKDHWNPLGGSFKFGTFDVGDLEQLDLAGEGGDSSAGYIIHETVEQFEKSKMGLEKGDYVREAYLAAHNKAQQAQNKVQGNRIIGEWNQGLKMIFLELDGSKTLQKIKLKHQGMSRFNMPIKVTKTKI